MKKGTNSKKSNEVYVPMLMSLDSLEDQGMLPDLLGGNLCQSRGKNRTFKEDTLGQRLKAARTRIGMTQEELAEAMLTTKSMISYYENDHGDMKQSMIAEFARILGTTAEYLACGIIKIPELDADAAELLQLFSSMNGSTKKIMLPQMRAVAKMKG